MPEKLKSVFKINDCGWNDILTNVDLMNIFWNVLDENIKNSDLEYFEKVGSLFQPIKFSFTLDISSYGQIRKINELDEEKFIIDALRTIKRCRTIDDNVYRKIDKLIISGKEYVLANGDEPIFRITEIPEGQYVLKPMIFASYNQKNIFKHSPYLNIPLNMPDSKIEIELSVENKKEGGLFTEMYHTILGKYKTKGFEPLEVNKKINP